MNTSEMSVRELLGTYCSVMDELRGRGIIRSSNNPAADYSELLFCTAFEWQRAGRSVSGFDAQYNGKRFQIKGRRLSAANPSRQLGFIRNLPKGEFDVLAAVLFGNDFSVFRAALIPHSVVQDHSRFSQHSNAWIFHLKNSVWDIEDVTDVTDALVAASRRLEDAAAADNHREPPRG